jgi:hypothetical protein
MKLVNNLLNLIYFTDFPQKYLSCRSIPIFLKLSEKKGEKGKTKTLLFFKVKYLVKYLSASTGKGT